MSMCKFISSVVKKSVYYDQHGLMTKLCYPLPYFILYSKAKLACYLMYLLASYFCIPIPYDESTYFFGVNSRRSCKSS